MRIMRIIDLSVLLDGDTQIYPGDPVPNMTPATRIETDQFNVLSLSLGSHTGTHVDAPYHVQPNGATLERLELGLFAGPGVIVDVTDLEPQQPILWEHVAPAADRFGDGAILAFRTGWSERYWRTDRYYDHPFLDPDACARILKLGVRTIAIDALNPDPTVLDGDATFPVHHLVLGAGGVIAENLTNLSAVGEADVLFCLFPLRLGSHADGAPCRAVALEFEPERDDSRSTPPAAA